MVPAFRYVRMWHGFSRSLIVAGSWLFLLFTAFISVAAQQTLHHELEVEIVHNALTDRRP